MNELSPKVIHVFPSIRPGGGPAGYGFNLLQALKIIEGDKRINILYPTKRSEDGNISSPRGAHTSKKFQLLLHLPAWMVGPLLFLYMLWFLKDSFRYFGFNSDQVKEIKNAKVVIFHDFRLASTYFYKKYKNQSQKVIIMPHSPTDVTSEMIENFRGNFGSSWIWSIICKILTKVELKTLLKSDGLLVPCRNALEAYFENEPERQCIFNLPIYEIKSGVPEKIAARKRDEVLAQWGIPPRMKVVGYFGRRHPHKGYDLFCQAAKLAYEKGYNDIVFVTAGKGFLPSPENLPNFYDLGYLTTELADAVSAVDLVVIPNRVSYFDLFVLEAMSLGKPILISRVGGNVCLESPGIFFLEELTPECIISTIMKLLSEHSNLEKAGKANREIYEKYYNLQAFGKRHLEFAQFILEEKCLKI